MKPFLLATQNDGKVREFRELMPSDFSSLLLPSPSSQKLEIEETGNTYRENALIKARTFAQLFQQPVLADDSGLEIDVLKGAPGVYSARFGGVSISWPDRWKYLYEQLSFTAESKWTARFRCVLCFYEVGSGPRYFEATVEGRILAAPLGDKGFGYDPVFYCDELSRGFGEASAEEKNRVSHRAKALRSFVEWYRQRKVS